MSSLVPAPFHMGECEGQLYFVEREIRGYTIAKPSSELDSIASKVICLLKRFHQETAEETQIDGTVFDTLITGNINVLAAVTKSREDLLTLEKVEAHLGRCLIGKRLPLVRTHGDFKIENVLLDLETNEVVGVIGWDLSQHRGFPLIDLFHFIMFNNASGSTANVAALINGKLIPLRFDDHENEAIFDYIGSLGISREFLSPLAIIYWLHHIPVRLGKEVMGSHYYMDLYYRKVLKTVDREIGTG